MKSELHKSTQPVQKVASSKKTKEWKESSLDYVISKAGTTEDSGRKDKLKLFYDLYNSVFDLKDLKYVTNPFNVEDGFPASPQEFNIIKPKIDLLLGESTKRPFNLRVIQTNDEATSQIQEKTKELLSQYIMQELGIDPNADPKGQDQMSLQQIQEYMGKTYKTNVEEIALHSLNYLKEKLQLPYEFFKGMRDALICGEEIYYKGIINGEPYLERVNPIEIDYDRDNNTEFIEKGDWALRTTDMTVSAIYDRFFDLLEESDLDKLLDIVNGDKISNQRADQVNSSSIMFKENISDTFITSKDEEANTFMLTVYHGTWKSYKKVYFLTYTDENGEGKTDYVDETYEPGPGETIDKQWVLEIWEGYKVGEDIYFGIKPVEYQNVSINNPNSNTLPYGGAIYSHINSNAKSLVGIMKPLQYMYIIIWYRLELALARDKGKIITMDITQIPKSLGVDVNKWLHYLTSVGVNFINPYDEGWDIPGREGGKPSQFNQFSQQDLTMSNVLMGYIELLNKLEDMIGELSGVSKQRQGSISTNELVGSVERAVVQSSHITEPIFYVHAMVMKNQISDLLNISKHAWNGQDKKIHYIFNDSQRILLEVTDDFLNSDLDVFLSDATKEVTNIEKLQSLLQPAMQNGATLLDMAEILSSDNLTEIKTRLNVIETNRAKAQQAAQEKELQVEQFKNEVTLEGLRITEEDSKRKAETAIEVAYIQADSKMNEGQEPEQSEPEDNSLEYEKLSVTRDKARRDADLKARQVEETIRKNKATESMKKEEIEIKRKVANRPVPSKTK